MTQRDKLREAVFRQLTSKEINGTTAAESLEMSTRQVRRLKQRYKALGLKGLLHKLRGKMSHRKLSEKATKKIMKIVKEKYIDFGPTLANEKLKDIHGIDLSTESLRQLMINQKLWIAKPVQTEKYPHTWRARKDSFGEMEQYDGSYFD